MIVVIDYGMGNLRSVGKAIETLGGKVCISDKPTVIEHAQKLVLPGVGSFGHAMRELRSRGLVKPIQKAIAAKKPFLGICLGLQLLFESSEESPRTKGLGVIRGRVKRFRLKKNLKIPQMGWNQMKILKRTPYFSGVPDRSFFYFVHSFYAAPKEGAVTIGTTNYGISFASAVQKENVTAVQFHPEKSQKVGLTILKNFIKQ
ncbi:MAG: imidazole glycerol phosphate synthase subunit HisH [Candidatus Omnitrophica bacterium CG11_big_fil_rev_8_21_14_0_20_45_26]|uniref:Imidazole glycerol phosphate synthase subunit HisH n=1 Tax=Candidatus Abzuiibacterium crystallinum TaxID=1974748 RepID=A0A2H0LSD0_9BACT|nr:MAG: imidazole glycerol phosphate synthase subunit HisH [Candidatus Omnitrophica bacterium CG11_big_fil_rev_8_21_14_0_20_45_26]PIW65025.1 MAG: imidazole glycerol phosphate synthase subunit HisH [Candidatus Omnitrophica bacterium CG12_big_fil_rev_8_21_14_0_65_45_16]